MILQNVLKLYNKILNGCYIHTIYVGIKKNQNRFVIMFCKFSYMPTFCIDRIKLYSIKVYDHCRY